MARQVLGQVGALPAVRQEAVAVDHEGQRAVGALREPEGGAQSAARCAGKAAVGAGRPARVDEAQLAARDAVRAGLEPARALRARRGPLRPQPSYNFV